jgi:hypothetical protein
MLCLIILTFKHEKSFWLVLKCKSPFLIICYFSSVGVRGTHPYLAMQNIKILYSLIYFIGVFPKHLTFSDSLGLFNNL